MNVVNEEQQDLYKDLILDHGRHPRNFGSLSDHTHRQHGLNPLCGDELSFELLVSENLIKDLKFQGKGCAISMASASLLGQAVKGKSVADASFLFKEFIRMMVEGECSVEGKEALGKVGVLSSVRAYPMRVKCATLAWHVLEAALLQKQEEVSTEK